MKLQCPVPDCTYKTEDLTDASLLTVLLNLHATAHAKPATAAETVARSEHLNFSDFRTLQDEQMSKICFAISSDMIQSFS